MCEFSGRIFGFPFDSLCASEYIFSQLSADNNITTGKIYQSVIQRERAGEYLGKTVQVPFISFRTHDSGSTSEKRAIMIELT